MNRKQIAVLALSVSAATGLGYGLRAWAAGVPSTGALTYSGVLEDSNGPVNGSRQIQVTFYDSATANDTPLCQAPTASVAVADGHFSVALPDPCATVVGNSPDVWVDVQVDGNDIPRTKIGAVPYAIEANHAVSATSATTAATANAAGGTLASTIATLTSASPNVSAFSAYQTQPQNFPSGAGQTVLFDHTDWDLGSEFNTSTGVFKTKTGGIYQVTCRIEWNVASTGSTEYFQTTIYLNQNTNTGIEVGYRVDGYYATVEASGIVKLSAGDTLVCQGYQGSGSTLASEDTASGNNSATRFSAVRIAP